MTGYSTMRGILLAAGIIVATAASVPAQDDSAVLGAMVVYLDETRRDHATMEELWVRDGVFDVSRHRIKRSFGEPTREWSQAEKLHLESAARSIGLPLRFCHENCNEHPDSALLLVFGDVNRTSTERAVVSIQAAASDEKGSWETSYEMVLVRSQEGLWSVTEARPGTHADAVSCDALYGHSCEEEKKKREAASGT